MLSWDLTTNICVETLYGLNGARSVWSRLFWKRSYEISFTTNKLRNAAVFLSFSGINLIMNLLTLLLWSFITIFANASCLVPPPQQWESDYLSTIFLLKKRNNNNLLLAKFQPWRLVSTKTSQVRRTYFSALSIPSLL